MNPVIQSEGARFSSETPVLPWQRQYLYIAPSQHIAIEAFIEKNIDEIRNTSIYTFNYIPSMTDSMDAILQYNRPGSDASIAEMYRRDRDFIYSLYREIASYRIDKADWQPSQPTIILFDGLMGTNTISATIYTLHYENEMQFAALLHAVITQPQQEQPVIFSSSITEQRPAPTRDDPRDNADYSEINTLVGEIQTRIDQLKMMGLSDYLIRKMIVLPEAKLSPLRITSDLRLMLPAYNNMEITMPTLSRVVYFFYLRHAEGMRFKELYLHHEELMQIYCRLSKRADLMNMERSIDELVDSTRNSINEKCSRIRSAFVSQFNDDLARNYYITGNAGSPKRITLDRNMVIDEAQILV